MAAINILSKKTGVNPVFSLRNAHIYVHATHKYVHFTYILFIKIIDRNLQHIVDIVTLRKKEILLNILCLYILKGGALQQEQPLLCIHILLFQSLEEISQKG